MSDSGFARRTGADYAQAFAALLPQGEAWPRDPDRDLMLYVGGQASVWGDVVDARAADLLERESDPRTTLEMLVEWERAFGLPDPCVDEPLTIADRRTALLNRMTTEGGQSRAFFIGVAALLGYTITIKEWSPFMVGISPVGDTRPTGTAGEQYPWEIGPPEMRFYWSIKVGTVRLSWFRAGPSGGQAGLDPHLRIAVATDLECLMRRWKPAHTEVLFDYSGVGAPNPMAGTP